jgi:hypothetical protein
MKRPVHLPLYNEFLELFDNYKIQNWQANNFGKSLKLDHNYRNQNQATYVFWFKSFDAISIFRS